MKEKDLNIFVRFGGLDLKNQRGYSKEPKTFHSPPASRGFYAMPKLAQELFLISGMSSYQPGTTPKHPKRDDEKSFSENEQIILRYEKRYKKSISLMKKEFFKKDGFIWHHLLDRVENHEVVDRHGSWVKTSITAWKKAFRKESINCRYGQSKLEINITNINEPIISGLFGFYSKDHLEVFFDEKV
jgi:hypothetical protein